VAARRQTRSTLTDGESLPRAALYDHIPAMLAAFERGLRQAAAGPEDASESAGLESGAAHGLQPWQQGYDLREVSQELGKSMNVSFWNWTTTQRPIPAFLSM
jgi:hypothetical protein